MAIRTKYGVRSEQKLSFFIAKVFAHLYCKGKKSVCSDPLGEL